jgi:hypothetical protein
MSFTMVLVSFFIAIFLFCEVDSGERALLKCCFSFHTSLRGVARVRRLRSGGGAG